MADKLRKVSPLTSNRQFKMLLSQPETSIMHDSESGITQDDEMREVSVQLTIIRKKHDQTREANHKKRAEVERLKKEIEKLDVMASMTEGDQMNINARMEQLQNALDLTREKVEEELQNKKIYEHMLNRMKQEKLAIELKANSLQNNLKSARQILEIEKDKSRKSNEARFQSKQILKDIKETLQYEKKKKDERIQQLEKTVRLRREAAMRREERQRRQLEIAEQAAHEDKDAEELKMKEILTLHRFWYNVLKWKLEKETQAASDVEEAFQKIRAATGITDPNEVVEKFLTREETHTQLMEAVAEAEKKLDELKEENERTRAQFQVLQLVEGEAGDVGFMRQVRDLDANISDISKQLTNTNEKLEKAMEVYDQVRDWGIKILSRLESDAKLDIQPASRIEETNNTLKDLFDAIKESVTVMIDQIGDRRDEFKSHLAKEASKTTSQIYSEIATSEFLAKNVRVKPRRKESEMSSDEDPEEEEDIEGSKKKKPVRG